MQNKSLQSLVLGILLLSFITFGTRIYLAEHSSAEPLPNVRAVIVTTARDSDGRRRLLAYDCGTATYAVKPHLPELRKLCIGYSVLAADTPPSALITGNKKQSRLLLDVKNFDTFGCAYNSGLFYAVHLDKRILTVGCYDSAGNLHNNIQLDTRDAIMMQVSGHSFAVSKDWFVLVMYEKGNPAISNLHLFDRKGKLVKVLRAGICPQFTADGRYLAYVMAKPGNRNYCPKANNDIVFFDLKKMRIKLILPLDSRVNDSSVNFRLASDGNSVIIASPERRALTKFRDTFACDISGGVPRWYKLPIRVWSTDWAIYSRMPKSFLRLPNLRGIDQGSMLFGNLVPETSEQSRN